MPKQRSQSCYERKIKKLTVYWNNCLKLQKIITLEKWIEKIKKPQGEKR